MTTKLRCPVCGDYGVLMMKTTVTKIAGKRYTYEKWYVYHNKSKGTKQRWCYLSKKYLELPEITEAIQKEQATQNNISPTQNIPTTTQRKNNLKSSSIHQKNQTQVKNLYSNVLLPNVLKICVSLNSMEGPGGSDR